MRTEDSLRTALRSAADEAPDPQLALQRALARREHGLPPHRGALAIAVFAVAAAVVLVLALLAVPALRNGRTAEPADTRAPGNWQLVAQIEPPPGWEVSSRTVLGDEELTEIQTDATAQTPARCAIRTVGPGKGWPEPPLDDPRGERVRVGGRDGVLIDAEGAEAPAGLTWKPTPQLWVNVDCSSLTEASLEGAQRRAMLVDTARRVVLKPNTFAMPLRLASLPDGYLVDALSASVDTETRQPQSGVRLSSPGPQARPRLWIHAGADAARLDPGTPGVEPVRIGARTGTLSVYQALLCVPADGGGEWCVEAEEPNLGLSELRTLLIETAEAVRPAASMTDPGTWFASTDVVP